MNEPKEYRTYATEWWEAIPGVLPHDQADSSPDERMEVEVQGSRDFPTLSGFKVLSGFTAVPILR